MSRAGRPRTCSIGRVSRYDTAVSSEQTYDFDLFVIGAGSGGVRAARMAGAAGARVAVAEASDLGGTCVNLGCVPKKLLMYASAYRDAFEDAAGFGWTVGPRTFDWQALIKRKNAEISRLNGIYGRLLDNTGVELVRGYARVVGPHQVEVGDTRYTAKNILVATGSRPVVPAIAGAEHIVTSDQAFHLPELPRRIAVVGGGYIGVEFAGIFEGMGAEVTLVHRGEKLLRGFDDDLRTRLGESLRARGIDLRLRDEITAIKQVGEGYEASLKSGDVVTVDLVMYATGRRPNTKGLGLEQVGVALGQRGEVLVDELFRTNVPSIWALGDVIDRVALTPVALEEGMALVQTLCFDNPQSIDYTNIPTAVFSQPPIATVGLTEAEAEAQAPDGIDVYTSEFRPMRNTLSGRGQKTFMKLLVDRQSDRVLGVHMLGPDGPEIIQALAICLKMGATKAQFDATIGLHPSTAEEFVTMRSKRK